MNMSYISGHYGRKIRSISEDGLDMDQDAIDFAAEMGDNDLSDSDGDMDALLASMETGDE